MSWDRREFLKETGKLIVLSAAASNALDFILAGQPEASEAYRMVDHWWAMMIDIEKCIGCGNCVRACKDENDVPKEPYFFIKPSTSIVHDGESVVIPPQSKNIHHEVEAHRLLPVRGHCRLRGSPAP